MRNQIRSAPQARVRSWLIKSVHITNYYHKNSGGISTSYNALMAAAGRHKRYMRLIVPGEKEEIEEVNDYARIYYVPAPKSFLFDKRYRVILPWQYMSGDSLIRKILLEEMPDMVEITDKYTLSMFGTMVRRGKFNQLNRPMLVHFSCERMDDNVASFLSKGRIGRWLAQTVMGNYNVPSFDFHIANSPYTAKELTGSVAAKFGNGRKWFINKCWQVFRAPRVPIEERLYVCPRGVDADQFSPERKSPEIRAELVEKAGIPEESIVILYAGRISPEKNIGLLPEFMKVLAKDKKNDYRLVVAGDGPQADWLKETSESELQGKIVLLGHLDKETLANYYANCDVFVHPNPKEPFGIAPLEAMASGVPTVVPNAGGLLFYATDENTWLMEPEAEQFAAAIKETVENKALRKSKIKAALKTAEDNTRIKSTDNLLATYDKIYKDFCSRKELFVGADESAAFDFREMAKATSS
ncbi:MAG: glycosyltransferase [Pyrinomonadaceae bacterium]|nr:glycosyltransferase [Pyrinomonadaceae bacterium]